MTRATVHLHSTTGPSPRIIPGNKSVLSVLFFIVILPFLRKHWSPRYSREMDGLKEDAQDRRIAPVEYCRFPLQIAPTPGQQTVLRRRLLPGAQTRARLDLYCLSQIWVGKGRSPTL